MRVRNWIGVWVGVGIRVGVSVRSALGIERRVATEVEAEIENEIDEVGTRVSPILQVRDGNQTRRVNVSVGALDDHVARGIHVDAGRVAGVGLHEPDDHGDVVSDALERHGDGAVGLEEVDGAAVVVREGGRFGLERREGGGERHQVLADEPLGILGVRDGGGSALGEDGVEELRHRRLHHADSDWGLEEKKKLRLLSMSFLPS